jgi:hypothetical protein
VHIISSATSRPKPDGTPESCEDAWGPEAADGDFERFRCAVADGASTSAFARDWARILVRDFIAEVALESSQASWQAGIADSDGPWWLSHKVAEGAHAAFLGLELSDDGSWQAIAWGDVCLFQLRSSQRILSFPLDSVADFPNQPLLLCSLGDNPKPHQTEGNWEPGDLFLVASDAVARQLFDLPTSATWEDLAPTNDDMTLMRIEVS